MFTVPGLNLEPLAQGHLYVKRNRKLDDPNPADSLWFRYVYYPAQEQSSRGGIFISVSFLTVGVFGSDLWLDTDCPDSSLS
jgi:hypothetical protein